MAETGKTDWSVLKGTLISFGLCLVVSGALIGGGYYFSERMNNELDQNKRAFRSISGKYLNVDQEKQLILDYYPKFVELYKRGLIGRERRLNWIEALRRSGENVNIPELGYSINAREEFTPGYELNHAGYKLYRSGMELKLGLLHEHELFELLDKIEQNANGAFTVSECTFNRNGAEIKFEKNHPNVYATCLLHWITIDAAGDNRIEMG